MDKVQARESLEKKVFLCRAEGMLQFQAGTTLHIRANLSTKRWTSKLAPEGELKPALGCSDQPYFIVPSRAEVVWRGNKNLVVFLTVEGLKDQTLDFIQLAESTSVHSYELAALLTLDKLVLLLARRGLLEPEVVARDYSRFEKCKALSLGTDKLGEREAAYKKGLLLGRKICRL